MECSNHPLPHYPYTDWYINGMYMQEPKTNSSLMAAPLICAEN